MLKCLRTSLSAVLEQAHAPDFDKPIRLERTQNRAHGDFATNLAMQLAPILDAKPRDIAAQLCQNMPASQHISKVEIAGPGFINFHTTQANRQEVVKTVLQQGDDYGCVTQNNTSIQIEFVSANPTGPLHVGHGRSAAYGSCLANILRACGYQVNCEYYINDAGRQTNILGLSLWLRYLQVCGETIAMPERAYRGEYLEKHAHTIHATHSKRWHQPAAKWSTHLAPTDGEQEDAHLDRLIEHMRDLLGEREFMCIRKIATEHILAQIREELDAFRVSYDNWFHESDLLPEATEKTIQRLQKTRYTEERDGNLWFLSTNFGDDRDRVLRRKNGTFTYFASDIAYHLNKFGRDLQHCINVWGADHHGYIKRIHSALEALDIQPKRLEIRLVQLVSLRRGKESVSMSTRSGQFVDLATLREEVGVDAARFFYIMRRIDQSTDFDIALAKMTNKDNPVYYIQYAHTRLCGLQRTMDETGVHWEVATGTNALHVLQHSEELQLLRRLSTYPEIIERAGSERAPHLLATFLRELAGEFHLFYNNHRVLADDAQIRDARIALSFAVKQVIANGLRLLGLNAPQRM